MSRNKGTHKRRDACPRGFFEEVYWGSADYNKRLYFAFRDMITKLALTRFEWVNLPKTIDTWYLETVLLYNGAATIARPIASIDGAEKHGFWYAAKYVRESARNNVYGRPCKWQALGADGAMRFEATSKNGVLVYENMTEMPLINIIDLYARELVDVHKTEQMNRMHQKIPYLIECSPDMELTAINYMKQILGGEPAIIANKGLSDISLSAVSLNVPYLGEELSAAEATLWNKIYTALGIANVTFKTERMIEDEVRSMSEPATKIALASLMTRRQALDRLKDRFPSDFGEAQVVWARDNESENYNAMHDIKQLVDMSVGETHGLFDARESKGEEM